MRSAIAALGLVVAALGGCVTAPADPAASAGPAKAAVDASPQAVFFSRLQGLCGASFPGVVEVGDPELDADLFESALSMGPVQCEEGVVSAPFAVGADRSRTWIFTQTPEGLRLKHRHGHDGQEDPLSQYGGTTADEGTAERQSFPVDAFSRTLFLRSARLASVQNVWAVEILPGEAFVYELSRPGRLVRVRFDTRTPINR